MHIIFLTSTLNNTGGLPRMSQEINERVKQAGHSVEVLTADKELVDSDLRNVAQQIRPRLLKADVIHALDAYPFGVIANLVQTNKPVVISAVGTYSVRYLNWSLSFKNFGIRRQLKKAYCQAHAVAAISNYVAQKVKEHLPDLKIDVIPLGVDYERFSKLKSIDHSNLNILSVGDVKRRKGYHIAITALAQVHREIRNLHYTIAGLTPHTSYRQELEILIKKYQLTDCVTFAGQINETQLDELYAKSDIFILPSINVSGAFEGFGLAFLEAQAASLPVVGTLDNGIADAMQADKTGFLVPQNDPPALAQAILKLAKDAQLRKNMGQMGRDFAHTMDWQKTVNAYLKIYEQISKK